MISTISIISILPNSTFARVCMAHGSADSDACALHHLLTPDGLQTENLVSDCQLCQHPCGRAQERSTAHASTCRTVTETCWLQPVLVHPGEPALRASEVVITSVSRTAACDLTVSWQTHPSIPIAYVHRSIAMAHPLHGAHCACRCWAQCLRHYGLDRDVTRDQVNEHSYADDE